MLKRIISLVVGSVGLANALGGEAAFPIGTAKVTPPTGWREEKKEEERITFRSPDNRQEATVSLMRFGKEASFDEFKIICEHRIAAEKKFLDNGFVQSDAPFSADGSFCMFFSGADKKTGRVFSGYLRCKKRELITIYVEGVGVAPKDELDSFQQFVKGLK